MYSQEVNGTRVGLHCREMRLVPWRAWSGIDSRILKGEDQVVVWWSRDPLCKGMDAMYCFFYVSFFMLAEVFFDISLWCCVLLILFEGSMFWLAHVFLRLLKLAWFLLKLWWIGLLDFFHAWWFLRSWCCIWLMWRADEFYLKSLEFLMLMVDVAGWVYCDMAGWWSLTLNLLMLIFTVWLAGLYPWLSACWSDWL